MIRHRILFNYENEQDDHFINMAFSKKAVEQRKEWLTGWMEEGKRRKELGLPEVKLHVVWVSLDSGLILFPDRCTCTRRTRAR